MLKRLTDFESADCQSAKQQVTNLRYEEVALHGKAAKVAKKRLERQL